MRFSTRSVAVAVVVVAVLVTSVKKWKSASLPVTEVDMTDKVIIVTGASAGVGKETARILAGWGGRVIMACRDEKKATRVLLDIKNTTKSDQVEVWQLDLASFRSVRAFAERFVKSKMPLHLLINNAGLVISHREVTEDGHELTYQTNHLGHFLLTKLLMPQLLASAPSRTVQVSSDLHRMGKLPFDDLDREKSYESALSVYADSKLMNVLFAKELHKRYGGVLSTSVHPGFVQTEILRDAANDMWLNINQKLARWFARNEHQGALTSIYAATHPTAIEGGVYYTDCQPGTMWNRLAVNETLAAQLWDVSETAVAKWAKPL